MFVHTRRAAMQMGMWADCRRLTMSSLTRRRRGTDRVILKSVAGDDAWPIYPGLTSDETGSGAWLPILESPQSDGTSIVLAAHGFHFYHCFIIISVILQPLRRPFRNDRLTARPESLYSSSPGRGRCDECENLVPLILSLLHDFLLSSQIA